MLKRLRRLLPLLMLLAGAGQAAEPVFKAAIVTESRVYERNASTFSVTGFETAGNPVTRSRVTVAIDGMHVTAEWQPKTLRSPTANAFRRGSAVPVAVERNKLLLKLPDGSVVEARIVDREKANPEDGDD